MALTDTKQTIGQFIVPPPREWVAYAIVAPCLLVLFNIRVFLQVITGDAAVNNVSFREELLVRPEFMNNILSAPILATAIPFILWAAVGAFSYMTVWLLISYFSRVHDDVKLIGFRHPKTFDSSRYWGSLAGHYLLLACVIFVMAVYIGLSLTTFLPSCSNAFGQALLDLPQASGFIGLAVSSVALIIVLHIGRLLLQITHNAWHTFIK